MSQFWSLVPLGWLLVFISNLGKIAIYVWWRCNGVARGGGRGGRAGGPLRVSPFWGGTILWCETVTPPICGKYLSFFTLFSFGLKTLWFSGEDLFFLVFTYFWTDIPLVLQRRPFLFFFLVFAYFWYKKGCHHKIPPRVLPSVATPLWRWSFLKFCLT